MENVAVCSKLKSVLWPDTVMGVFLAEEQRTSYATCLAHFDTYRLSAACVHTCSLTEFFHAVLSVQVRVGRAGLQFAT